MAVDWMSAVSDDDFVDFLPQLLEALKLETWTVSPLATLMLERSLKSPKVCHSLYWLMAQALPGQTPHGMEFFVSEFALWLFFTSFIMGFSF